jgi:hypothetical protein
MYALFVVVLTIYFCDTNVFEILAKNFLRKLNIFIIKLKYSVLTI